MADDKTIHGFYATEVARIARAVRGLERRPGDGGGDDDHGHDGPNVQVVKVTAEASAGRKKYTGIFLRSPQQEVKFYNLQEQQDGPTEFEVGDYVWITTTDFDYLKPLVNDELTTGNNWVSASAAVPLNALQVTQENAGTPSVAGVKIISVLSRDLGAGRGELDVVDETLAGQPKEVSIRNRQPVRKNSTGIEIVRRRLNFIEGTNITITLSDSGGNDMGDTDEADITIAASGGSLNVKENNASIVAAATAMDFDGDDFDVTDEGGNEAGVATSGTTAAATGDSVHVPTELNHGLAKSIVTVDPVANGTYTVGDAITAKGNVGRITTSSGLITAVQEAT